MKSQSIGILIACNVNSDCNSNYYHEKNSISGRIFFFMSEELFLSSFDRSSDFMFAK